MGLRANRRDEAKASTKRGGGRDQKGGTSFTQQKKDIELETRCPLSAFLVPKEGLEPSLPCENWILNPARLPIPPLRLITTNVLNIAPFAKSP